MTSRKRFINSTLALGVLVGAVLLTWTATVPNRDRTIPPRPQAVAIDVAVEGPAAEPLPAIRVPDLTPQEAPEPGRSGAGIRRSPRPCLRLAVLEGAPYREDLPNITVPDLRQPLPPLPRPSRA